MKAEIITIGDEILIGQIIDTNSAYIARQLNDIGIDVFQITSVSDNAAHIVKALDDAHTRAQVILITGGLGPTADDITKPTLSNYFGGKLIQNNEVLEDIKRYLSGRSRVLNERNIKQAEVPDVCTVIRNPVGTAPCMWFEKNGVITVSMPGVPFEMKELMKEIVIRLKNKLPGTFIEHETIITFGLGESMMADLIHDWEINLPNFIKLAYLPSPEGLRLRLTGKYHQYEPLMEALNIEKLKLTTIIDKYIIGMYDGEYLPITIGKRLISLGESLSTAESCTGGNIAHQITLIPGCSAYFKGSVVAYSNQIKVNVLGVSDKDIHEFGAVSKQVVEQMASGARKLMGTTYAIATSGIAGPDGGTPEKPAGTVWYALAWEGGVEARTYQFNINREINIRIATSHALNLLRLKLDNIL